MIYVRVAKVTQKGRFTQAKEGATDLLIWAFYWKLRGRKTMPGDSSIITYSIDTTRLRDFPLQPEYELPSGRIFLGVVLVVGALLILNRYLYSLRVRRRAAERRRIFEDRFLQVRHWLESYNPYYQKLDFTSRERFLNRVLDYAGSKEFYYKGVMEEERIAILISAAAVQLTFGLKAFRMDYFRNIYVLQRDYNYVGYNVPFEGHVSAQGIFLSWANFEKAFADYTDGVNVGLHEMAHALTYVNFVSRQGADPAFRKRFVVFSKTGRPAFERHKAQPSAFLGRYATTNYQEFWAVCVEQFFERPAMFRDFDPELYRALQVLLNQDPERPGTLLQSIEN